MRYTTAGESHGRALVTVVTGVPAGLPVDVDLINADLARRQRGYGRGGRMAIETDKVSVLSGVRFGLTIGSPVALTIVNRDWDNWTDVMASTGDKPLGSRVVSPRPGHADLAGVQKTGSDDVRDILERASARETAARVAAGGIAKAFLRQVGVTVDSCVSAIGGVYADPEVITRADSALVEASEVRCPDGAASELMKRAIDSARSSGESLGGVFVVTAVGLVPGLGTYAEADGRLDARLAAAVMSIPALKGFESRGRFRLGRCSGEQGSRRDSVRPRARNTCAPPTGRADLRAGCRTASS